MEHTPKQYTRHTLVVNFFGGPSTGKSTWSAGLFFKLKLADINVELLPEFAKELTWREDFDTLSYDQEYVIAKQIRRQRTVLGKVDVCITDSPILFGLVYGRHCSENWQQGIVDTFNTFDNLNIFIERDVEKYQYQPEGRRQKLEQSIAIDNAIKDVFTELNIPFQTIKINGMETLDQLESLVMERLGVEVPEYTITDEDMVAVFGTLFVEKCKDVIVSHCDHYNSKFWNIVANVCDTLIKKLG